MRRKKPFFVESSHNCGKTGGDIEKSDAYSYNYIKLSLIIASYRAEKEVNIRGNG